MTTTREKLAAVLVERCGEYGNAQAIDALCAIVEAEREAALSDAENACEGVYSFFGCWGDAAEGASRCVREIRALKTKAVDGESPENQRTER